MRGKHLNVHYRTAGDDANTTPLMKWSRNIGGRGVQLV